MEDYTAQREICSQSQMLSDDILKLLQWWEILVYCVNELQRFCLVVKRDVRPDTGMDGKWLLKEVRQLTITFFPSAILQFSIITEL